MRANGIQSFYPRLRGFADDCNVTLHRWLARCTGRCTWCCGMEVLVNDAGDLRPCPYCRESVYDRVREANR